MSAGSTSGETPTLDRDVCAARLITDPAYQDERRKRSKSSRSGNDRRASTQRDLARVLYSPYLQRLSGVTQILSPDPRVPLMHSRLTHTLKVSLVARELAEDLIRRARDDPATAAGIRSKGGIDALVCEVAGLAHDLGHPPFGHLGETLINDFIRYSGPFAKSQLPSPPPLPVRVGTRLLELCDVDSVAAHGFEGNAQSFRIVTRLDSHRSAALEDQLGLDLTAASLAAILKYPWWRPNQDGPRAKKYNVYPDDLAAFDRARRWATPLVGKHSQTLEASIMDLADDITYAVHDLQDFLLAGLIDAADVLKDLAGVQANMARPEYLDAATMSSEDFHSFKVTREASDTAISPIEAAYMQAAQEQRGFVTREAFQQALRWVSDWLADLPASVMGTLRQEVQIRTACNKLIAELMGDIAFHDAPAWPGGPHIYPSAHAWHIMLICKQVARRYIVNAPQVGVAQRSQRAALTDLLQALDDWLEDEPRPSELPEPLRTYVVQAEPHPATNTPLKHRGVDTRRCIADFVCSLTDFKALQWAAWLKGRALPTLGEI